MQKATVPRVHRRRVSGRSIPTGTTTEPTIATAVTGVIPDVSMGSPTTSSGPRAEASSEGATCHTAGISKSQLEPMVGLTNPDATAGAATGNNPTATRTRKKSDTEPPNEEYRTTDRGIPTDGLAIACHVPEKIKQAIRESKYVDLEKLLLCNELDEEGEVILYRLVQKKRATEAIKIKHKIDGITAWVKAFTVYMVIYLEAHPENAAYLASYISAIVWWNSTFEWNAVYNYDKDLRRKREKIPETPWTAVDFELMKEMQLHERDHSPPPYDPKKECRQYNGGFCSRSAAACRWAHKCLNCGKKGHPVVKCWHLKSTPK